MPTTFDWTLRGRMTQQAGAKIKTARFTIIPNHPQMLEQVGLAIHHGLPGLLDTKLAGTPGSVFRCER